MARTRAIYEQHGLAGVMLLGADKLWVLASYPVQRRRWSRRTFEIAGTRYPYFVHHYNATWRNERAVEVAVALDFVQQCGRRRGLEIGNVLGYYADVTHTVVDKYERRPGVVNADAADYDPEFPPEYIVSISTFEHVGWDEDPHDPSRAEAALNRLRSLLAPGGRMLVTVPLGHNPGLDDAIRSHRLRTSGGAFLVRRPRGWVEVDQGVAFDAAAFPRRQGRWGRHAPTNAICVAELDRS